MYNLDIFEIHKENSYEILINLCDYTLDSNIEEVYDTYLKHYDFLATYNSLKMSANTMDYDAKKDYERLGNIDQILRPKFSEYKKNIKDDVITRELKHKNSELYLTQVFSQAGSNSWEKYYEYLISSLADSDGVGLTTHISNLESSDTELRSSSFVKIKEICKTNSESFAFCLNAIKKQAQVVAKLRGFETVLEMSLYDDRISSTTIESLVAAIEDNKEIFNDYLARANKNKYYEIQSLSNSSLSFTYAEACELVLATFKEYDLELYNLSKKMIENNYIDIYPRNNKTTGGFCLSANIVGESRILLNFTGNLNDVFTLAHELGHAFHFHLLKDELKIHQLYTMPLAESASNLCEVILYHYIKDKYPEAKEQRKIDLTYIFLDIYTRYLFEDEAVIKRNDGELSGAEYSEIFLKHQKNVFTTMDEFNEYMWILKPHYYDSKANYYNYPYAIGCIIANLLYTKDITYIKEFLRNTGKMEVEELIELDFKEFFSNIKGEFYE